MISFIKTAKAISLVIDGKSFNVSSSHPSYVEICDELKKGKGASAEELKHLIDVEKVLNGKTFGKVTVTADAVYYSGRPVGTALSQRIIDMLREGYDIEPWALFMDNVYKNPEDFAREELYLFLEGGNLPITPDGCFLAFKNVRPDMCSHHDGKTLHVLNEVLEFPREKVDKNRHNTCSTGLHFCSQDYLSVYSDHPERGLVLLLKINPADVVSIPSDYKNTKGRAWRYTPISILSGTPEAKSDTFKKPVLGKLTNGQETFVDEKLDKAEKTPKNKTSAKFDGKTPSSFLKAIKAAGGARPYAKDKGLAKSTVQDWVKKARDVLGV